MIFNNVIRGFVESIWKNAYGIIFILLSAVMLSIGQLVWKISSGQSLILLLAGFCIYGIGAIFMIIAYKYGSFSTIHPMMSTSYVLALLFGWLLLNESITLGMITGLTLILIGNICIGVGDA